MKTVTFDSRKPERKWWVLDAREAVIGRLASTAAKLLMGKHKTTYSPNHDRGDFVVIINAEKVAFTGKKRNEVRYFQHSMYPGGWRELTVDQAMHNRPGYPIRHAVLGMLPHNSRGRLMAQKLHIYDGDQHPHAAQKPAAMAVR